jgi:hypothetical protein
LRIQRYREKRRVRRLESEKIHEPAEEKSSHNHDEEKKKRVFYLAFSVIPSDKREHDADKDCIKNHGEKMAFPDHFFFPEAISKASSATR